MPARDSQRQKVYDAEQAAFPGKAIEMSVPEMQALVNKWCSSPTIQSRWPRAHFPPTVTDGRARFRTACYAPTKHEIRMPRPLRKKWVLIHELAHALVKATPDRPWHGWEFCECYLYLVRIYMGRSSEEILKRQFKLHKVKFSPPRTRKVSPEAREAARQRMLDMHAKRSMVRT